MINKKLFIISIVVLLFTTLIIVDCFAIGISPGKRTYAYDKGAVIKGVIKIYNPDKKDIDVKISTAGELSYAIHPDRTYIEISNKTYITKINYTLTIPKLDVPGKHIGKIVILGINKDKIKGNVAIVPKISLNFRIEVEVPYPGKYVVAKLNVPDVSTNSTIKTYINVENKGKEPISEIYSIISIGKEQKTSKKQSLNVSQKKQIITGFEKLKAGDYVANAKVFYDKKVINLNQTFSVGDFFLKILGIGADFNKKGITQIDISIKNIANRKVRSAYADLLLEGNTISSPRYDIDSDTSKIFSLYLDTPAKGNYTGKLRVFYETKSIEKNIKIEITDTGMYFDRITGNMAIDQKMIEPKSNLFINILIVIILSLSIIYIILYYRKKDKTKDNK